MNKDSRREIHLPEEEARQFFKKRTRRSFLTAGVAAVAAVGGYEWLSTRRQEAMVPWPERRVLRVNEALAHGYLSDQHLAPHLSAVGHSTSEAEWGLWTGR